MEKTQTPTEELLERDREPDMIAADPLGEVDVTARVAMLRRMAANPKYEFIVRDYCGCHDYPKTVCPEFEAVRIRAQSDYPYTSAHDYNGDGKGDFAIMIALKGKEAGSPAHLQRPLRRRHSDTRLQRRGLAAQRPRERRVCRRERVGQRL